MKIKAFNPQVFESSPYKEHYEHYKAFKENLKALTNHAKRSGLDDFHSFLLELKKMVEDFSPIYIVGNFQIKQLGYWTREGIKKKVKHMFENNISTDFKEICKWLTEFNNSKVAKKLKFHASSFNDVNLKLPITHYADTSNFLMRILDMISIFTIEAFKL